MALIPCDECGRTVSDQATACPQCGYPISFDPIEDEPHHVTIEKTSKPIKATLLVSFAAFAYGLGSYFFNDHRNGPPGDMATLSLVLGGVVFVFTKVYAWWNHG